MIYGLGLGPRRHDQIRFMPVATCRIAPPKTVTQYNHVGGGDTVSKHVIMFFSCLVCLRCLVCTMRLETHRERVGKSAKHI